MNTVHALVDATDGRRVLADVEITDRVRLGCGCTRSEGIRPGPETEQTRQWRESTGRPPMVHLLTGGCPRHTDDTQTHHRGEIMKTEDYYTDGLIIANISRAQSSANGNPRYRVAFTNGTQARTGVDAQVGYAITNPEYKDVPLRVRFTPRGDIVDVTVIK